jgi:WD40 repeat protein
MTSSIPVINDLGRPSDQVRSPLFARDVRTGEVREWFPKDQRLTLVDPGVDGRQVLVGRVLLGRPRLFLHDATGGGVITELPQGGPEADDRIDPMPHSFEQFAAFRPDGRQIVYSYRFGGRWLRIWDVDSGREIAAIPDAGPPAAWSEDGRMMAYTTRSRGLSLESVHLWDGGTRATRAFHSFTPLSEELKQLAFSPDGQTLTGVIGERIEGRGTLDIWDRVIGWDVETGRETYRYDTSWACLLRGLPWFAMADYSNGPNALVHRYDYASGMHRGDFGARGFFGQSWSGLSPDGLLALGSREQATPLLEMLNRHFPAQFPQPTSSERPLLVGTDTDRFVYSLPMDLDRQFRSRPPCAWSQDGAMLAIAGNDMVAVWDIPPRKSATWFAVGAALFALPPFLIARRQVRGLLQEAAA